VQGNTISENPGCGLGLDTTLSSITVSDNVFNNTCNVGAPSGVTGVIWFVPPTAGQNIIGGPYLGGNYWAQPNGYGWSQTHYAGSDGFIAEPYQVIDGESNYDLLPLGYLAPPITVTAHFSADPTEGTVTETRPLVVQFTDESTGPIDSWAWNFGDGSNATGQEGPHTFYNVGMYIVSLTVTNSASGISDTYISGIYVRPEIPEGVPIWPGWNFVSVPKTLEAGHDTAGIVFADVIPNTEGKPIWTYNASASPKWKTLAMDDKLQTLDAYWIYSTQIGPYVPYTYSTDTSPTVPRVKSLAKGWNAIGLGSVYGGPIEQELPTIQDNWQVILDFNNANQVYYLPIVNGHANGQQMIPTKGYWIYMDSEGDLVAMTG
jgi:PKD repeat protein